MKSWTPPMRNIARTWWLAVPKTISIDATASAP
jgi:hypothetical protein